MSLPAAQEVRKIAVFRPNAVGDFMFCLPALYSLRDSFRNAEIVYLGREWHRDFLDDRPGPVDRVVVVPEIDGIGQPAAAAPASAAVTNEFIAAMREEQFDIALQMFGGGRYANPLVNAFQARLAVGMRSPEAEPLARNIAYVRAVNQRLQLLEVAALAGASSWSMTTDLAVTAADRLAAARLVPEAPQRPMVLLQPGASDVRRQWPASRFAALGGALAALGVQVVINGSEAEAPLTRSVAVAMRHQAIDLSGRASLSALCGLLERAALVVSNDTGPLHMALALGRPCVGIYWFTNLIESAPLRQQGHRAALSLRTRCPECGTENISVRCPHQASFVDDVPLEEVLALSMALLEGRTEQSQ